MNKRTQAMLENFSDREIRYILQYAQSHLELDFEPEDGTLQGDILLRINQIIKESRR